MYRTDDTICAVASPPGGGARGIVRLSGPQSHRIALGGYQGPPPSQLAIEDELSRPLSLRGEWRLDDRLTLNGTAHCWPHGHSYTGQAMAELHLPATPPLLDATVAWACRQGTRLAEPGEFTLRALLAGRIDLAQAEAILGVIEAAGSRQLDVALRQLAGGLSTPIGRLRDRLLDLLAELEAGLDFADESLDLLDRREAVDLLEGIQHDVQRIADQMQSRHESTGGLVAVLVGPPNAGKSSLFNALLGRDAALVDAAPGTTRDYLVGRLDLGDVTCQLIDTAGGVDGTTAAAFDRLSARQTRQAEQTAQVRLLCVDSSEPLARAQHEQLQRLDPTRDSLVWTKADLAAAEHVDQSPATFVSTSARTGVGLDALREHLRRQAIESAPCDGEVVAATAQRSADTIRSAAAAVARARLCLWGDAGRSPVGDELAAAEIRTALDELARVVGAVYTEDMLDRLFGKFCIGK
jgi:tRNA modification GTPase